MSTAARRVILTAGVLLAWIAPAGAIQNGTPDGNGHPAVGFILATVPGGDPCNLGSQAVGCTGVLVSSTVFLTSGGCTDAFLGAIQSGFVDRVWVDFNPNNSFNCADFVDVDESQIATNPVFSAGTGNGNAGSSGDVGVMVLAQPSTITPATLPVAARLDGLPTSQPYVAVAFGGTRSANILEQIRRFADARFLGLGPDNLFLALDPDAGGGDRPCIGTLNEAGPAYVGSSNEIVALVLEDHGNCPANGRFQRLDVQNVRSFLANYVTLP
jgi:hypothetical protein